MSRKGRWQLIVVILLLLSTRSVLAHGGGILQIASEPAGPFRVSVWTSPPRLEAGELAHITVGVADADEAPVLDSLVLVEMVSHETGEVRSTTATTEQATNKLYYEADLRVGEDGRYTITIHVDGPQGRGEVSFGLDILPQGKTNWILLGFIGLGLILSMLMFRLWEKQPLSLPTRQR